MRFVDYTTSSVLNFQEIQFEPNTNLSSLEPSTNTKSYFSGQIGADCGPEF